MAIGVPVSPPTPPMSIASLPLRRRNHDDHRSARLDAHQQARLVTGYDALLGVVPIAARSSFSVVVVIGFVHGYCRARAPLHASLKAERNGLTAAVAEV